MRGGGPPSAYSSCVRLQGRGKFLQCHCEDSSTKQSSLSFRVCRAKLDCFAALATTAGSTHSRPSRYNALRHCLRQTRSVCAGSEATKQSSFVVRKLDCFAALAMTGPGHFRKSPVQPSAQKYLASSPTRNTFLITPSRPTKGRSRSSRTRGGMRWTLL